MDPQLTTILEAALQHGIWAALYIYLFFRMLSENKAREDKYQNTIEYMSENIKQGIVEIKHTLDKMMADKNHDKTA